MNKPVKLKEVIESKIKDNVFYKLEFLKINWENIVGKNLAKRSFPLFVKEDILIIGVTSSIWSQQMLFLKNQIINNTNSKLNGEYIKNIKFKVSKYEKANKYIEEKKVKEIEQINFNNISIQPFEIKQLKKAIEPIKDDEIKKSIYRVSILNKKREKYLLKNGYKKCDKCGEIFIGEGKFCIICKNKIEKKNKKRIYNKIKKNLLITYAEMKYEEKYLDKIKFEDIKNTIKDEIYREVLIKIKEAKNKKDEIKEVKYNEVRDLLERYFTLDSGTDNKRVIFEKINMFFKSFT